MFFKTQSQCADCGKYKGVMRNVKGPSTEQQERATRAQPSEARPQQRRDTEAAGSASDARSWAGAAHAASPWGFAPRSRPGTCCLCYSRASSMWLMPNTRFTRTSGRGTSWGKTSKTGQKKKRISPLVKCQRRTASFQREEVERRGL